MESSGWIVVGLGVLGAFVLYLTLMSTVALYRATTLTKAQKLAQLAIAWFIPILGARLVLHFLVQQDVEAIPDQLFPNETIDHYMRVALGIPARETLKLMKSVVEQQIYETVASHFSGDGSAGGAGADGGSE